MELNQFWAKMNPFQSVVTHAVVSGTVCRHLMKRYLSNGSRQLVASQLNMSEEELSDFMAYFVSLHDIGKIEYHFQCKDPEMKAKFRELGLDKCYIGKENIRHEKTAETVLDRIWKSQNQDEDFTNIFSAMITSFLILGRNHSSRGGFFLLYMKAVGHREYDLSKKMRLMENFYPGIKM